MGKGPRLVAPPGNAERSSASPLLRLCLTHTPHTLLLPCLPRARSQRTASYFVHSNAGHVVFSNIRKFASDLSSVLPDHMVCVPLILDTLQAKVGGSRFAQCDCVLCVCVCVVCVCMCE